MPIIFTLLPQSILLRAVSLGAIGVALLAMPLWAMLQLSGIGEVSLITAVLLKVGITIVLTLAIVPVVILAGVADLQPTRQQQMLAASRS